MALAAVLVAPAYATEKLTVESLSLVEAVKLGEEARVDYWLAQGVDVNDPQGSAYTPLFFAAAKGHAGLAGKLLAAGADANAAGRGGWTPLMVAAFHGHGEVLDVLLQQPVALERQSADGMTALMYAAAYNQLDATTRLIDRGANVNANTAREGVARGKSALFLAVEKGHREMAALLLQQGAKPYDGERDIIPAIFAAALGNRVDILEVFSQNRVSLATADTRGNTVLHYCASRIDPATLEFLLDNGVPVDRLNARGETALQLAAAEGNTENTLLLYARTASPDRTRGFLAAVTSGVYSSVEALLEQGAKVNQADREGVTPLMLAVARRHEKVVEVLLAHGADIAAEDVNGRNAMDYALAAMPVDQRVVELLAPADV